MLKLKNIKVKHKLSLLIGIAILGFVSILLISANTLKQNLLNEREAQLRAVVDAALSQINTLNQQLPPEQAKQRATEIIKSIHFNDNNYIYVMDSSRHILVHPTQAELEGKQMGNAGRNSEQGFWYQMVDAGKQPQGGLITYPWHDQQGEPADKIAFLKSINSWDWILGSGMLINDIDSAVQQQTTKMALATLVIILIMAALGFVITRAITSPLNSIKDVMLAISKGNLTVTVPTFGKDEIGLVGQRINESIASIREALNESVSSAKELAKAASRIASSAEETSQAITAQHDQLNQLATAMNQMSASIAEVATYTESTASNTMNANTEVGKGNKDVSDSVTGIKNLSSELKQASLQVEKLKEGVIEISDVTNVISSISEQTNLLALNAAIEAARAGEQGRGFAVVADEVRSLAGRTNQSTEEIQTTINRLQKLAIDTANMMEKSTSLADSSVQSAEHCGQDLQDIVAHIQNVADQSTQIATATEEQSAVAEDMNRNVSGISDATQEMREASSFLAQESETLAVMSHQLDAKLQRFTLQ